MKYTLIWREAATVGWARIRATDSQAAKDIRSVVSSLANDPFPADSHALGKGGLRRIHAERARILYEINDADEAMEILTVGRVLGTGAG